MKPIAAPPILCKLSESCPGERLLGTKAAADHDELFAVQVAVHPNPAPPGERERSPLQTPHVNASHDWRERALKMQLCFPHCRAGCLGFGESASAARASVPVYDLDICDATMKAAATHIIVDCRVSLIVIEPVLGYAIEPAVAAWPQG